MTNQVCQPSLKRELQRRLLRTNRWASVILTTMRISMKYLSNLITHNNRRLPRWRKNEGERETSTKIQNYLVTELSKPRGHHIWMEFRKSKLPNWRQSLIRKSEKWAKSNWEGERLTWSAENKLQTGCRSTLKGNILVVTSNTDNPSTSSSFMASSLIVCQGHHITIEAIQRTEEDNKKTKSKYWMTILQRMNRSRWPL